MKPGIRSRTAVFLCAAFAAASALAAPGSVELFANSANDYDYIRQNTIPGGFGDGEFTMELWIRPNDSFPVGPVSGGANQRNNWSNVDNQPYSSGSWWYSGNFLLDGHNNNTFRNGTFSLQFYGGGRVRWLFGDGANAGPGGHWSVGAFPATNAPSLLDGQWHQVTLVRRWSGASAAALELWIDGTLIDSETSTARTDMRQWWNNWAGFPGSQSGWFWGAEKQAAIGLLGQYEDYKGLVDEVRFWSRAKSAAEISTGYMNPVTGTEPGLVGNYTFGEAAGTNICDSLTPAVCMQLVNAFPNVWSASNAPLAAGGDSTPPSVPTNLQGMAASTSQIDLSWNASTDNVGVTGYEIRRDGMLIDTVAGTTYSNTGLAASTTYSYTVAARDAAGNSSAQSSAISVTTQTSPDTSPPSVPTGLQGTAASTSQIDLTWNASSDNVGVTGYEIRRDGVLIATTPQTNYSDTGLSANSSYSYTVAARDAAGNSSAESGAVSVATLSAPDTTPPSVPTGLQGSAASTTRIDLTWNASTDNVGVTGYEVRRDGALIATVPGTGYSDTGLGANTSYSYTVTARDAAGNTSAESGAVSVTTLIVPDTAPPSVPGGLQGSAASTTQIDLAWTASTDNVGVTGYEVRRDGMLVDTVVQTSYSDTGLSANTSYSYTVSARDAAGNSSAESGAVPVSTLASPDTEAPSIPAGVDASATSSSAIRLTWTASTDNVTVSDYEIFRDGTGIATSTATTFNDSGLSANTAYTYNVVAVDAAGNRSAQSAVASATTLPAPNPPPANKSSGGGAAGLLMLLMLVSGHVANRRRRPLVFR